MAKTGGNDEEKLKQRILDATYRTLSIAVVSFFWAICFVGPGPLFQNSTGFAGSLYRKFFFAIENAEIRWAVFFWLTVCGGTFCLLMRQLKDLLLIGLWLCALAACFVGSSIALKASTLVFLAGMTVDSGIRFFRTTISHRGTDRFKSFCSLRRLLVILVAQLALASPWHLDVTHNYYHGTRWMGLWDDPNCFGTLMGVGCVLAIGLFAVNAGFGARLLKSGTDHNKPKSKMFLTSFLSVAAAMTFIGLMMSYSRGAWLGTAAGFVYLAWCYGKLNWKYVAPGVVVVAAIILFCWGNTSDLAPWYIKRMDLRRPSAGHRVSAWLAGLEIMRDHVFGVGWNNTVSVYKKNYSPPEDGADAITTNDYLMIGTQMGVPALLCFLAYLSVCFYQSPRVWHALSVAAKSTRFCGVEGNAQNPTGSTTGLVAPRYEIGGGSSANIQWSLSLQDECLRAICMAGVLVLIVTFWFDAGVFKVTTGSLFWVLLGLGHPSSGEERLNVGFSWTIMRQYISAARGKVGERGFNPETAYVERTDKNEPDN